MCSPIGDGAAALVLVSPKKAKATRAEGRDPRASSVLATGFDYADGEQTVPEYAVQRALRRQGSARRTLTSSSCTTRRRRPSSSTTSTSALAKKNEGSR